MAFAAPPPKAHCFTFSAPEGSTVDDVIDALEVVTGPAGIKSLQHMGGVKFGAAAANVHAATKLKSRGAILLNGVLVPLVSVGPEIVHVTVFRVPLWVAAAAAAADEQEGIDLTPPAPALQEFPALETESDTDTPDTESHAESQDAGDLPPPSEKVSSIPGAPAETSDSSPDAYEDHSASKAEAPVSVPSRDHESCSSDTGGTTSSSEAPRTSMGRGTRATGRAEAPIVGPDKTTTVIMPPTATSTRASKYSAQTRKLSLSNPLHKITGSAAVMSAGASAMEIERQATKRAHPPTTDSEGSTDSTSFVLANLAQKSRIWTISWTLLSRPCFQLTCHYPRIWTYVHAPDNLTASVEPPTSTRNLAAVVMPSMVLLRPDTNPFTPLQELEEQNNIEGKSDNASGQARIISTAPNGEKRARGSLLPMPEREYTNVPGDFSHARRASHMHPASARHQDEDGSWIPVSYRRKQQNHATVAPTPSSGSLRKYPHTVILRPKQPCRIMDEQFIRLDRVITRHISAHLDVSEEDPLPEFTVR
ncbi:hypothetical protein HPB52_022963 [Rhipicephalus sanguineus]|uniref:Uncharacterized protein n=1 Tax=Rhipicephalus sanguineus TaxID=34632 RepID=A0A9D4PK15_RHISA|nr:hypothetical protein HPB52_022963 [Rhipicephalus sanguineus]